LLPLRFGSPAPRAASVALRSLSAGRYFAWAKWPRGNLNPARKLLRFGLQIGSPRCVESLAAPGVQKLLWRPKAKLRERLGLLSHRQLVSRTFEIHGKDRRIEGSTARRAFGAQCNIRLTGGSANPNARPSALLSFL